MLEWLSSFVVRCISSLSENDAFRRCFPIKNDVQMKGRRLRILRQLGEGGYSYVYLVRDVTAPGGGMQPQQQSLFALKRIWAVTEEQLQEARHEIDTIRRLGHANLLQMIDSAEVPKKNDSGVTGSEVFILFPVYLEGSLTDEVDRRAIAGDPFSPAQVLDIFAQVCRAVAAMHSMSPALAHRDIKPQNILLSREGGNGEGGGGDARYRVALTDFGSARVAVTEVSSRRDALRLQEDAERNCTAPYRAPELFDVPSDCVVDGRVDVWSLGCVLFYTMYGVSPFESALGEAGGSIALAVMNGRVGWPRDPPRRYPEALHQLVLKCLETNPAVRPHIHGILESVESLAAGDLSCGR